MSWNISVYVEELTDNGYRLIGEDSLCSNGKFYFQDELHWKNFDHVDVSTLSNGLKQLYHIENTSNSETDINAYLCSHYTMTCCSLDELMCRVKSSVAMFMKEMQVMMKALGVPCFLDDDNICYCKDTDIDEDESDNAFSKESKLTFPVNKELLTDHIESMEKYSRLCMIQGMFMPFTEWEDSKKYRIIFIET